MVTFPESWLDELSQAVYGHELQHRERGVRILDADTNEHFHSSLSHLLRNCDIASNEDLKTRFLNVTKQFIEHFMRPGVFEPENEAIDRSRRVVLAAIEYVIGHIGHQLGLADICKSLDVSERTLHYAFKKTLDISPAQFIRATRYNHVRREFKQNSAASITQILEKNGSSIRVSSPAHIAVFSANYRQNR